MRIYRILLRWPINIIEIWKPEFVCASEEERTLHGSNSFVLGVLEFIMLCGYVFCPGIEIRLYQISFIKISFIIQVLSDPQKKAIYDQYGEEGLKDMPPPGSASFPFGNGGGSESSGFNPRNAEDIFAEFFGSSPFGFGSSGPGKSMRYQSEGGVFGGFGGSENIFRTYSENVTPKKPPPVESKLPCTLEELYSGSTRKMKISRTVVDANGYAIFICFSSSQHFHLLSLFL